MTDEVVIPGNDKQLSVDDLLLLNGRVNAELELERTRRAHLVQAYMGLKAERDRLQDALNTLEQQK